MNSAYDRLCRLAAERTIVHSPRGFEPREARASPLPLKSHPGLALSPHPPPLAELGKPSAVNGAASRGFSRSSAGLPWAESIASRPPPGVKDSGSAENWSGRFKTEYSVRYAAPSTQAMVNSLNARALNHQRLIFTAPSESPLNVTPFEGQPFAAFSHPKPTPFQNSPRGTALGCSYRDNWTRSRC